MKSLSIYAITRKQNTEQLQKLERQLSGRAYFLKMRDWEMNSMKAFVDQLDQHMVEVYALRFLSGQRDVRKLFHQLGRAKEELALLQGGKRV